MRKYIFSDEAGDFNFSRGANISNYFIITSVTFDSYDIGNGLTDLKHKLSWNGLCNDGFSHASEDDQVVRDHVFEYLQKQDFHIDSTILEKSKAQPQTKPEDEEVDSLNARFYKLAWYFHLKHVAPRYTRDIQVDELCVVASAIATKRKRAIFREALNDVAQQTIKGADWRTAFWPCSTDPCLQIADYCCWAIQRKWEMGCVRSYDLISDKIVREKDLFEAGTKHYY